MSARHLLYAFGPLFLLSVLIGAGCYLFTGRL